MSMVTFHGAHVAPPAPAPALMPTPEQVQARRNAVWLRAVEVGMYDPATNRKRPHSTAEIALLWDVSPRTVQLGLASARKLRDSLRGE
jgi:hypothetical protein